LAWCHELAGKKFNMLTVIEKVGKDKWGSILWLCKCDCGNFTTLTSCSIKTGGTRSCGCLRITNRVEVGKKCRKMCKYDLSGEYGIGYTTKGVEFFFDLEDYDKIKDCGWTAERGKYLRTRQKSEEFGDAFHHFILEVPPSIWIDHANRNPLDNRKANLRVATISQNTMNQGLNPRNTSGVTGVYLNKKKGWWFASVSIDKKLTWLGNFTNFQDAVIARLKAEKEYYGEFAPQRHLFEQYGIK
jgi:hypothetical protein